MKKLVVCLLAVLLCSGCTARPDRQVRILFEDRGDFYFPGQQYALAAGGELSVTLGIPKGQVIAEVNFPRYSVSGLVKTSQSYDYYTLSLHDVDYSSILRISTAQRQSVTYFWADGSLEDTSVSPHLYANALPYRDAFAQPGQSAIGWQDAQTLIGFGSRIWPQADHLQLATLPAAPETDFLYRPAKTGAVITGYSGHGDLVIPQTLGGQPVTEIAAGAFAEIQAENVVFPASLRHIADGAFAALHAEHLYLFDSLETISEAAMGDYQITHLHINAATAPKYSGSYFDIYPDKVDYLHASQGKRKLALFCGSSARFGCDSPRLQAAFPDYTVINLGVYAYANMLPQAHIALSLMEPGDVLLSSPELDAIDTQFCGETALERETFCLMESNYDLFARLDARCYSNVFGALGEYLAARRNMAPRSYQESAWSFDEDGARVETPSYNRAGDYILYREDNEARKNFGIKRAFYHPAYLRQQDLDGLTAVYSAFLEKGIRVYFAYSPRSATSISPDSNAETAQALDARLRTALPVPILTDIADSLMDPLYFYGTDNHLSTHGVSLHTGHIIEALAPYLEETP